MKWEYKKVVISADEDLIANLNQLGEEGWQLSALTAVDFGKVNITVDMEADVILYTCILKRIKAELGDREKSALLAYFGGKVG